MLELIKNAIEEHKAKRNSKKDELSFGRTFLLAMCDLKKLSEEINELTEELEEEN